MSGIYLRKYGEAGTVDFSLYEVDGVNFRVDAVHAAGDTTIMKNEGTPTNTANGFVDEGKAYSITFTATEMEAARIMVDIVDQTGIKIWLDQTIIIETYGHENAQHAFDFDTAEVDSNIIKIGGVAARATDLAEIAQYLIANTATLTDIVADNSIIAKLLATNGDISGFNEATDALQAIRAAINEGVPSLHVPDSASVIIEGNQNANTYLVCATDDSTRWQIGDTGAGIEVICEMNLGVNRFATNVLVNGYFNAAPAGSNVVEIYAWNYLTSSWDKLSAGSVATEMRDDNSDNNYEFSLIHGHHDPVINPGEVKIRFLSNGLNNGDELLLDHVSISASPYGAATAESVAQAVWEYNLFNIRSEYAAGHDLKRTVVVEGNIAVENSTISFTITAGIPVANAYVGMLVDVRDLSSTTRDIETRRITSYTSGRVITVDRAFSFIPAVGDHAHILGLSYANISAENIGVAALNQINAEVVDTLNVDVYPEPGQGEPPATASIVAKLNSMYKSWRNKKDNDGVTRKIYNDEGTVVDQKSSLNEVAGTVTVGKIESGP